MGAPEADARSRRLEPLVKGLGALALAVLLLVAFYVGAGRYLMTQVGAYEADLEAMLSERLGRSVQVDQLAGSWAGLDPIILVDGLRINASEGADAATLQRLRIRLATLASLVRGRLVLSEVSASDADLTLTQDATGGLGLDGLWEPAMDEVVGLDILEAAAQDFDRPLADRIRELAKFLADPVLRIADLRLTVRTPDHADQHYRVPLLDLAFQHGTFSAAGRLTRIDGPGPGSAIANPTETVAWFTFSGSHFLDGRFDGVLYLDIRSERLFDTLLQRYNWSDIGIEGIDLRTSAWLTFEDGGLVRALAELKSPYLQLRAPDSSLVLLEDLEATLTARPVLPQHCAESDPCDPLWEVQAKGLQYRGQGQSVGPLDMQWFKWPGSWKLAVDTVAIESVSELIADLEVLPAPATDALRSTRPKGVINRLAVEYAGPDLWRITADLHQVAIDAYKGAPVIQGFDGWLEHKPTGGRVLYDAGDITLGFPELFSAPWRFERITGEVAWLREGKGWHILGQDLRLRYSGETVLGGDFNLSLWPDRSNTLGLRVGVLGGRHEHVVQFFPVGVAGEPLYNWLSGALRGGTIPWGWYYGSGRVQPDAPSPTAAEAVSAAQEGRQVEGGGPATESSERFTSAMVYDFREVDLAYAEDWPALQQGRGQFRYQGKRGWVDIEEARVGGLRLQRSQVFLDTDPDLRISISTGTAVTGADLDFWVTNTPLGATAADLVEEVDIDGKADLNLGLALFPGSESELGPLVDASVILQGISVTHRDSGIQWRDLTGTLGYDSERGLTSQDIRGNFLEHEVRLGIAGGASGRPAEIHQWGRATVAEVSHQLSQPLPFMSGEFDYDLRASVGEGIQALLGFQVDLAQTGVGLPVPLAKAPGTAGRLQGNLVAEGNGQIRVQGSWADRLAFQLLWHGGELGEASVMLGGESAPLRNGEYFLGGSIDQLVVEDWVDALTPLLAADEGSGGEFGTGPDAGTESVFPPFSAELSTGQLSIAGNDMGAVDLHVDPADGDWRIAAAGPRLTGVGVWRREGPHWLELEHLALPGDRAGDPEDARSGLSREAGRNFPDADVRIESLQLGDARYGGWQFELRSREDALAVNALRAQTGSLVFDGQLIWQYHHGDQGLTHLSGRLEGGNIQDLSAWLQAGVPLSSKSTGAEMDLSWPGSPPEFSLGNLQGEMALGLKNGTILDQNNAAQVFRIFGILNADTLLRRLRLDFSDLYQAGVSFEALSGRAVVKDGILTLDPELQLTGPSGAFRLTGSTHLIRETLDMRLVVVLPLTQNLPVAALLFGAGAPIGGALFILDKLLGDPLSKLTSATYDVSGGWEKPEVRLRNIFDTGSGVRN